MKIILRADSGFCREQMMQWCEKNAVDYVFGLARNCRLVRSIGAQKGMRCDAVDEVVAVVEARLEANRRAA